MSRATAVSQCAELNNVLSCALNSVYFLAANGAVLQQENVKSFKTCNSMYRPAKRAAKNCAYPVVCVSPVITMLERKETKLWLSREAEILNITSLC